MPIPKEESPVPPRPYNGGNGMSDIDTKPVEIMPVDNYYCPLNLRAVKSYASSTDYSVLEPVFADSKPPQSNRDGCGGDSDASASMSFRSASGWLRNFSRFRC